MWHEITRTVIAVAPISVPKSSALNKIITDSQSMTSEPDVDTQDDLPEIVVPVTGLSHVNVSEFLDAQGAPVRKWGSVAQLLISALRIGYFLCRFVS
jgi:hypothetical protein